MKKFNKCSLEDLKAGDRFYFLTDKAKSVYEVLKFFSGKTERAEVQQIPGTHKQVVSATREVVFLNSRLERTGRE